MKLLYKNYTENGWNEYQLMLSVPLLKEMSFPQSCKVLEINFFLLGTPQEFSVV